MPNFSFLIFLVKPSLFLVNEFLALIFGKRPVVKQKFINKQLIYSLLPIYLDLAGWLNLLGHGNSKYLLGFKII